MNINSISIRKPDNLHNHFRDDFRLEKLLPYTAEQFSRAIAMPNLDPPVRTGQQAIAYKKKIEDCAKELGYPNFQALATIYITPETTPAEILEAKNLGVVAGKLYPRHGTTQSSHGIFDYSANQLQDCFRAMAECGMLSLWHCEVPDQSILPKEREAKFIPILERVISAHPALKIVFEHISSKEGVKLVQDAPIAATVTAHHLFLTEEDCHNPHNCCMPTPKTKDDRDAICEAVLSENPKFFYGGDDAPHHRKFKEGVDKPAFGVWCGPTTLPVLAAFFDQAGALEALGSFTSVFGAHFYGLPLSGEEITLVREPWKVPDHYADVVPFRAGEILEWKLKPRSEG